MVNENQIIELLDGSTYLVLDKINYNNNNYLYIAKLNEDENPTGEFDIVKETIKEDVPLMDYIEDEDLYENLKLSFLGRSEVNSNI